MEPSDAVNAFIVAMHEWEKQADVEFQRAKENGTIGTLTERLLDSQAAVFERFCTSKPRTYGRNGSFERPPEYDSAKEKVISCEIQGRRGFCVHDPRFRIGSRGLPLRASQERRRLAN